MLSKQIFWSWPLSGEWQYSGDRGGHLIESSCPLQAAGSHEEARHREASCHCPANCTRLEADPVSVELAEWWLEVSCEAEHQ